MTPPFCNPIAKVLGSGTGGAPVAPVFLQWIKLCLKRVETLPGTEADRAHAQCTLSPYDQSKIERNHLSLKNNVNLQNYFLPGMLEAEIASFVEYYNFLRYHESLDNLTTVNV